MSGAPAAVCFAIFLAPALGCGGAPGPLLHSAVIQRPWVITRIRVSGDRFDDTFSITSPQRIAAVVAALPRESRGWDNSSFETPPSGDVSAAFLQGDSIVGVLWIGHGFVAERGDSARLMHDISAETESRLRGLLDPQHGASQGSPPWPVVAPLDTTFAVTNVNSPGVRTFVMAPSGEELYLFICRSGDDPGAPSDVNYAGDLDCRLIPAKLGEIEDNLLVEDSTLAAWYSRGRVFATELEGTCADYPEYGITRDFFLRGMRLTMQFSDVHADGVHLKEYRLRLRVTPDSTAQTAIAAKSGYLDPSRQVPGRSCDHVQRGDEWPARRPPG